MRIIKTKVYTIDEHPNKDLCFDYIRRNWYDLNQYSVDEFVDSLEALQQKIGGNLDYSISQFPSIGEFISFKNYDKNRLSELDAFTTELTGVCWDSDIIIALKNGNIFESIKSLHQYSDYVYSNEGLEDFCMANKYEFNEDGKPILHHQH
jgi:hypothetical protein